MKKKIFLAISMLMVLSVAVLAFAYNRSVMISTAKMDCCKGSDSCPMKNKDASGKTGSCCDDPNCCCNGGDSCPMKKGEAMARHEMGDMNHEAVASEHKSCDCSCCTKVENGSPVQLVN